MRKNAILRLLAYAAAAAVAALLALLLALRALFPPETVKSMAVERLSAALGRQVRVAAVSIGLRGADLRGLEISQSPDFSAGTLASVERLRVSARWLPMLLEKRFEVGAVSAEGWTVDLTSASFAAEAGAPRPPPGEENARPPRTAAPGPRSPPAHGIALPAAGGTPAGVSISQLRLEGGILRYTDASKGLSIRVADARAKFSGLALDRPFPLDLSFSLQVRREGAPTLSGKFSLEGRLDPARGEPERMSLDAAPLRFDLAGLPVSVRGSVKDFTAPELDLRWEAGLPRTVNAKLLASALGWTGLGGAIRLKTGKDAMTLDTLSMEREGFFLKATGSVSGLRARKPKPDFKLSLDAKIPSLPAAAVKIVWPSFPDRASLPPASLKTRGRWQGEKGLSFPSVDLLIGGLSARARGKASWEGPPRLDLDLETDPFEVSEFTVFFPRAAAYALAGKTRLKLHAWGPASSPTTTGEILPEKLRLTASSQTFTDLEGVVRFSSGSVDAKLKGRWNGAEAQLSVAAQGLAADSQERSFRVEGSLGEVDLAAFSAGPAAPSGRGERPPSGDRGPMAAAPVPAVPSAAETPPKPAPPLKSSGRLSIGRIKHPNFEAQKTELSWDLRGLSKDLSGLDGSVKLRTGEGRFENLGLLASENPILKTALLPFLILQKVSGLVKIPLFPAFDRVSFKEITGDYAFQKGVMAVKESHLDGSEAYVAVTGTADLAKDELDLRLSTKLGTQVGLRLSGPVGITVKGSLADPKVSVDPLSIIKQPGVDKVIEGGKKMLEEGGKKLLEGLFKK